MFGKKNVLLSVQGGMLNFIETIDSVLFMMSFHCYFILLFYFVVPLDNQQLVDLLKSLQLPPMSSVTEGPQKQALKGISSEGASETDGEEPSVCTYTAFSYLKL